MPIPSSRIRRAIAFAIIAAIWGVLLGLVAFFAFVFALYSDLKTPRRRHLVAGAGADAIAAKLYAVHFMPMWQADPNCAQFDPELIYVPKPGRSRFRGPEFDTQITITPTGLREQSAAPAAAEKSDAHAIILAGDSFTLGWGVNDEETFSAVLQRRYQRRTLNTGVPSYGTARELFRLRRLGLLANATAIVIQFCPNDAPENREFLADPRNFFANRNARQGWDELMRFGHADDVTFFRVLGATTGYLRFRASLEPFGQLVANLAVATKFDPPRQREPAAPAAMAADFVRVLDQFPEIAGKPILVTEMDGFGIDSGFLLELQKRTHGRPNFKVLRLQLQPADFFRFDPHLSPHGHETVAAQLNRALEELMSAEKSDPNR